MDKLDKLEKLELYKQYLEKYIKKGAEDIKLLHIFKKLHRIDVNYQDLEATQIGKAVKAFRKCEGDVGQSAKQLIEKWTKCISESAASHNGNSANKQETDDVCKQEETGRDKTPSCEPSTSEAHTKKSELSSHVDQEESKTVSHSSPKIKDKELDKVKVEQHRKSKSSFKDAKSRDRNNTHEMKKEKTRLYEGNGKGSLPSSSNELDKVKAEHSKVKSSREAKIKSESTKDSEKKTKLLDGNDKGSMPSSSNERDKVKAEQHSKLKSSREAKIKTESTKDSEIKEETKLLDGNDKGSLPSSSNLNGRSAEKKVSADTLYMKDDSVHVRSEKVKVKIEGDKSQSSCSKERKSRYEKEKRHESSDCNVKYIGEKSSHKEIEHSDIGQTHIGNVSNILDDDSLPDISDNDMQSPPNARRSAKFINLSSTGNSSGFSDYKEQSISAETNPAHKERNSCKISVSDKQSSSHAKPSKQQLSGDVAKHDKQKSECVNSIGSKKPNDHEMYPDVDTISAMLDSEFQSASLSQTGQNPAEDSGNGVHSDSTASLDDKIEQFRHQYISFQEKHDEKMDKKSKDMKKVHDMKDRRKMESKSDPSLFRKMDSHSEKSSQKYQASVKDKHSKDLDSRRHHHKHKEKKYDGNSKKRYDDKQKTKEATSGQGKSDRFKKEKRDRRDKNPSKMSKGSTAVKILEPNASFEEEDSQFCDNIVSFEEALIGATGGIKRKHVKESKGLLTKKKKLESKNGSAPHHKHVKKNTSGSAMEADVPMRPNIDKNGDAGSFDVNVPKPSEKLDVSYEDILEKLPETAPRYKPIPTKSKNYQEKDIDDHMITSKKQGHMQVYSGKARYYTKVPTLFELAERTLKDYVQVIDCYGDCTYDMMKNVLAVATPSQLEHLELCNPELADEDDELWAVHCHREFSNYNRKEDETFHEMYSRCKRERRESLRRVTQQVKHNIASSTPRKKTKLAYIDSFVKPPRDVLRKQLKYGTAGPGPKVTPHQRKLIQQSDHSRLSKGTMPGTSGLSSGGSPEKRFPVKKKPAPMMQKVRKMLMGRRK